MMCYAQDKPETAAAAAGEIPGAGPQRKTAGRGFAVAGSRLENREDTG